MKKILKIIPNSVYVFLVRTIFFFWFLTIRKKVNDPMGFFNKKKSPQEQYIFLLWHNRLYFMPMLVPSFYLKKCCGLVSMSRDGGILTDLIKSFGLKVIRGSSSKGGSKAMFEMEKMLNQKYNIVMTPDGPRGPKYDMKPGAIKLASKTGTAIIPVALNSQKHKELSNWDATQIPLPFSKLEFTYGEPISIPADISGDEFEKYRELVNAEMMSLIKWDHKKSPELSSGL